MDNNFEILERIKDDVQIIEINGELDAFVAPKLKETFNKLIEKDINKYIVDFKGLIHINSLAMGILRGKLQVVREMGGDIKIVNLNKHIQTIFWNNRIRRNIWNLQKWGRSIKKVSNK